jgi:glucose-1-phosphatase
MSNDLRSNDLRSIDLRSNDLRSKRPEGPLLFDLGGVFIRVHTDRLIGRIKDIFGAPSDDAVRRAVLDPPILSQYETGRLSDIEFFTAVQARIGRISSLPAFRDAWQGCFTPNRPMIRFLESLHGRCRLILVSNTNPMHAEYLIEHYPFLSCFDRLILSFESGTAKPDPGIYHDALAAADAHPHRCLFVDDSEENVAAALELGIPSRRFEGNRAFFRFWDQWLVTGED